ncbi:hypothetical protein niasHT_030375 [Heterodera trifolii]|uniref:Chromo domain-containing protein n=1 Tax=Heterodera trifolii TaxID=157864 RepID=A0ABD2K960_9BILA
MNQLDCFCLEPLYPPPNAPPDERFQAVVLPCCTGVSHFACIARQLRQTVKKPSPPPAAAAAAAAAHHHHHQLRAVQRIQGMQQQQQQVQAVQQPRRRTVRDDSRYEIAAIVCSRRAADGQARELRIHWRSFPYRDDTFEWEQAPQIHAAWLQVHDLGYTPPHNFQFPEQPQPWMSTVWSGRHLPVVESVYPGRNSAHRRLFGK